jgi:hypothetical protein
MAFKFGVSKEAIQETGFAPQLKVPYVGEAKLTKVSRERLGANEQEGKEGFDTIVYSFALAGNNEVEKNTEYREVIFAPNADATEEQIESLITRTTYINKYWLGEEMAIRISMVSGNTLLEVWDEFANNIVKAFSLTKYTSNIVRIKVLGSVYNGKARLRMPGYKTGFISDDKSDHPLTSFSAKEDKSNREFLAAEKSVPSGNESFTDVPANQGLSF